MKKRHAAFLPVPEANLLPVMNIMFLLVPGLLLAMEVASMAAVVVSPPAHGSPSSAPSDPPTERPLGLKVRIERDAFVVEAGGAALSGQALASDPTRRSRLVGRRPDAAPDDDDARDYAALETLATELKRAAVHERTVLVDAHADVPMQVLVRTLDHLRGSSCQGAGPDGQTQPGEGMCLFDQVVLVPTH